MGILEKKIPKTSNTCTEKSKERQRCEVDKVRVNEPMFANEEQSLFVSRQSVWITVKRLKFLFYLFFYRKHRSVVDRFIVKSYVFSLRPFDLDHFFISLFTQLQSNANLSRNSVQWCWDQRTRSVYPDKS